MGGLGFIFVISLYIFIAYKVVAVIERQWIQVVAIIAVLLIPTVDAIYGRIKLRNMCEAEAGLKIFRVAEHVEGFMDDNRDFWVKDGNYQFVEDYPTNGRVTRYFRQGGQIVREEHALPKSKYKVHLLHLGQVQNIYMRDQFSVEGIPSGEVLATDTQIYFNGGWVERFLAQFSDAGGGAVASCGYRDSIERYKKLVTATLKH